MKNNVSGIYNTAIGIYAGVNWTTGNHNIAIGHGAFGSPGDTGVIRIGGLFQSKTFIEGINNAPGVFSTDVCIDSASDQLGPCSASSVRFKQDIEDLGDLAEDLAALRPVSFRYTERFAGRKDPTRHYGLIAEEVAELFPNLVTYDDEGLPFTVRYEMLTPLLLRELQRHTEQLDRQRSTKKSRL